MKNKIIILIICLSMLFLIGCNNINPEQNSNNINNEESGEDNDNNKLEENNSLENSGAEAVEEKLCRIYYFDAENLKLVYIDKKVKVYDKALVTALTKELQSTTISEKLISLTDKVGVNSAKVDREKGILTVNFSDDYTKYMLLGTATEGGVLSALVNTYGYNYDIDKVAIYFNGELYTGLKGDLPEGYYKVSYLDVEKLDDV